MELNPFQTKQISLQHHGVNFTSIQQVSTANCFARNTLVSNPIEQVFFFFKVIKTIQKKN